MLSRFSSLRFLAANVSKLAATRRTTPPAFNLLLHTHACNDVPKKPEEIKKYDPNDPEQFVAVALAGCGHLDGTFPLEAMSLAINLQRHNFRAHFFAGYYEIVPYNHNDGSSWSDAERLIEKSSIYDLHELANEESRRRYSGLLIPGGGGVLKEEFKNAMETAIYEFYHTDKKPIGTISNAGYLVSSVLQGVRITIGKTPRTSNNDSSEIASHAVTMEKEHGAILEAANSSEVVHCAKYNVYSTPGHHGHCAATFWEIHRGIERLVEAMKDDIVSHKTPAKR